jgi:hypothetical protein
MLMVDNEYQELLRKVERLKQEKERAKGARNELLKRLKKDHKCANQENGVKRHRQLEDAERNLAVRCTTLKKKILKKWKKVL